LNRNFLSYLASYDVVSNLCQALHSGTAISSATVGIPATFTVNTRDAFGNAYVGKPGGGTWYSPYDGPARFAVILKNIRKGVEAGLGRNRSKPRTKRPFNMFADPRLLS
jgi:hypothetical protein